MKSILRIPDRSTRRKTIHRPGCCKRSRKAPTDAAAARMTWCCLVFFVATLSTATARAADLTVRYALDLRSTATHKVSVEMSVPDVPPGSEIQFPAWNALYQIRDFVRNVRDVRADCDGQKLKLKRVDLETWRTRSGTCSTLTVRYSVYANEEGPFSSILDDHHSFLNLAMLLFYLPHGRDRPARVSFVLPQGWKLATLLPASGSGVEFAAANYDALVDSPVEAGHFAEYDYQQDRAMYRVIVDASLQDYPSQRLLDSLEKITATETGLMRDVPFSRYTFIFHFLPAGGGGGMEHADGTAISLPASTARDNWQAVETTAAHEFFHLWNVKRIRPAGLEPVDYVHGNDTRALWFSEGVTSTYQELTLLRAGLTSREEFYRRIAFQIGTLQDRPAHLFQSVEDAGRAAWLEKYLDYLRPDRSISYYNKGELLGFLLDLGIRHATQNRASLDDVMRRLNDDFAKRHRFFTQADLLDVIGEVAPEFSGRKEFFRDYVSGTRELDYNTYLGYAGLELLTATAAQGALGFHAERGFSGPVTVESVDPASNAARAGISKGDALVKMNGRPLNYPPEELLSNTTGGEKVEFEVWRGGKTLTLKYRLEKSTVNSYRVQEKSHATDDELRVRDGWLEGKTNAAPER
jgi:predicted metalloprotease with PDZ domain